MKRFFRRLTGLLAVFMAVLFFFWGALMQLTPAALRTDRLTMSLPCVNYPLSLSYEGNDLSSQGEDSPQRLLNARLMLLGTFPVKDVSVSLESRPSCSLPDAF